MEKDVLFIFGPARGGTTFVASILENFFDYGMGPEGTFVHDAWRVAQKLGDLSQPKNLRSYATYLSQVQMLEIIRKRYPEGVRFDVTPGDIIQRMEGESAASGIYAVFKAVSDYKSKTRVGNKNPAYWKYLDLLLEMFPSQSRFLFLIRDGRDVALSLKKVPWGGHSIYEAALEWRKMIETVDRFKEHIPTHRFLTVRYEDLLQNPSAQIKRIAQLVEIKEYSEIIREFCKEMTANEKKVNFDKWKHEMTEKGIEQFEAIAGPELTAYGYERRFPRAKITFTEKIVNTIGRLVRLCKLNLYAMGVRLPQDTKKWRPSRFRKFIRPGNKEK